MNTYNSKIAKFVRSLNGIDSDTRFAITTSKDTTRYTCAEHEVSERFRKHEDKHKEQYTRYTWLGFVVRYLWYNITRGYKNNPFEIEAREAELR